MTFWTNKPNLFSAVWSVLIWCFFIGFKIPPRLNSSPSCDKKIVFIIGGPDGTSRDLSKIANETISLSKMTLPHLMARVILIEQLYRSLSIIINHPYHRD